MHIASKLNDQLNRLKVGIGDLRGAAGTPPSGSKFFHFHAVSPKIIG